MTSPQYEIAKAAFMAYWENQPRHPFEFYDDAEKRRWYKAARAAIAEVHRTMYVNWNAAMLNGEKPRDFIDECMERYS